MKKHISKLISLLLSLSIIVSSTVVYAGYSTSSLMNNISRSKWMSQIKDDTSIADISIPGTHDSAARIVDTFTGTWAQTQSLTISEQLEAGVRFLDLRLRYNTDVYYNVELCHSSITIWNGRGGHLTLYEVLSDVKSFLNNNPTETVIIDFKEDDGNNESSIVSSINQMKNDEFSNYWYQSYATPKLSEVRGKMVVMSRMSSMSGIYPYWGDQGSDGSYVQTNSQTIIQDRYNMGTDNKWNNAIVPTLEYKKPNGTWLINGLNTTGGGISGVSANASDINARFGRYTLVNNKCYGIILFDYINDDYTTKVIKCNDLVSKNRPEGLSSKYYYRLNVNNPDSVPSGWSNVSLRLYYKTNNGTGTESSVLLFENGDTYNGYAYVCQTGNYDFSGCLDGYPTRIAFTYNWGYGSDRLELDFKMYISNSPSSSMTQIMDTFFARTSGSSTPQNGIDFFSVDSASMPKPTSISFLNNNSTTINVPAVDSSATVTNQFNANVFDQYGVKWYANPTSYYLSSNLNGCTFNGNTLTVNQLANDNPPETEVYVMSRYANGSITLTTPYTKVIRLITNPIPYKFVDASGNILQTGSAYYGEAPVYNGNLPVKNYTSTEHYTFNNWSGTTISTSQRVFSPNFSTGEHSIDHTVLGPSATCIEDGYDTAYCSCGYSWQIVKKATGHNLVTDEKAVSCLEDGHRIVACTKCDYVESSEYYDATGHDYDNLTKGKHVDAIDGENGYFPYYCPRCNDELVELRSYDNNDFAAYYDAVKAYIDIISDKDYSSFDLASRTALENAVNPVLNIDENDIIFQYDIDNASSTILSAIEAFSNSIGVRFFAITFIKQNGETITTLYKEGTSASTVVKPANSSYKIDSTTHTVYKWQTVRTVTNNATYNEIASVSNHTFNTFIFPNEYVEPTCTEQGRTTYRCLCGYSYSEITDALDHMYSEIVKIDTTTKIIKYVCANDNSHIAQYDASAYVSAYELLKHEATNSEKYTDDTIVELNKAITTYKLLDNDGYTIVSKNDISANLDIYTSEILDLLNKIKQDSNIRNVIVKYAVCVNDAVVVPTTTIDRNVKYGDLLLDNIYSLVDGEHVVKWSITTSTGTRPFSNISTNLNYSACASESTLICYIEKDMSTSSKPYTVQFVDRSQKIRGVVAVNEDDIFRVDGNNIILNDEIVFTAEKLPYYQTREFLINGKIYTSETGDFHITADTNIYTKYSAGSAININVNQGVYFNDSVFVSTHYSANWDELVTLKDFIEDRQLDWYVDDVYMGTGSEFSIRANQDTNIRVVVANESIENVFSDGHMSKVDYFNYDVELNKVTAVVSFANLTYENDKYVLNNDLIEEAGVFLSTATNDIDEIQVKGKKFSGKRSNFADTGNQVKISVSRTANTSFYMYALPYIVVGGNTYVGQTVATINYKA